MVSVGAQGIVEAFAPHDLGRVSELSRSSGDTGLDLSSELTKPHCRVWVAREAARLPAVAFALCWEVADEMQLVDLATDPAFRRRGHARHLLRTVCDDARQRGCRLVVLEVRAHNDPALALYVGAGFEVARRRDGYYRDGEGALEMVLELARVAG